jgi:hypothetical protein
VTRKIEEAPSSAHPATDWIGVMAQTAIGPQATKAEIRFMACRIRMFRPVRTHRKIAFLNIEWRRKYADESLNTGVSFRKDDSGSNLVGP